MLFIWRKLEDCCRLECTRDGRDKKYVLACSETRGKDRSWPLRQKHVARCIEADSRDIISSDETVGT